MTILFIATISVTIHSTKRSYCDRPSSNDPNKHTWSS